MVTTSQPDPTAFPLQWPPGFPRTKNREKWPGPAVTLESSLKMCRDELGRFGAKGIILSSNVTLGISAPADPGVVAYFTRADLQIAVPCDRWMTVAGNLRAMAKTIEAMRGIERWGAKHMIQAMFSGLAALPMAGPGQQHWATVIGIPPGAPLPAVEAAYRLAASKAHPDKPGGSAERMAFLNIAIQQAREELSR